jgi:hypothetical protein
MGCSICTQRKKPKINIDHHPKETTQENGEIFPQTEINLYTIKEESAKNEESFIPSRAHSNIPCQSQKSYDFSSSLNI